MTTRVGTDQLQQSLLGRINTTTAEITRLQDQVSTGVRGTRYSALGDEAPRQINLSAQMRTFDQYKQTQAVVNGRLSAQETSIQAMFDIATKLRVDLMQARSGKIENQGNITEIARQAIDSVTSALNVSVGGDYVFGGIDTEQPPVKIDDNSILGPLAPGEPPPEKPVYFQGSKFKVKRASTRTAPSPTA